MSFCFLSLCFMAKVRIGKGFGERKPVPAPSPWRWSYLPFGFPSPDSLDGPGLKPLVAHTVGVGLRGLSGPRRPALAPVGRPLPDVVGVQVGPPAPANGPSRPVPVQGL